MAITEKPAIDATLLAIEEINRGGGLLGRRIEPVVVDGRSDGPTFARGAKWLLTRKQVASVFGGYTSASRRTMIPVFEKQHALLFYSTYYEGIEQSPNVVYTGATPNQHITPAVKWFLDNRGKKIFLVGSDYIFPRAVNAVIRAQLEAIGGEVLGEEYIPLGSEKVGPAIRKIIDADPDEIVSTVVGDTNIPFFKALRKAGVRPRTRPVLSLALTEEELKSLNSRQMAGDYIAMNYFQSIPGEHNAAFVRSFKQRYGSERVVSDLAEASHTSVMLWAQAVREAGSTDTVAVRRALSGARYDSPGGTVYVDRENQHLWKTARLGRIRADGQVDLVWQSETIIHPVPYSPYRRRQDWQDLLATLHGGWGNSWERPPGGPALDVRIGGGAP